MNWCRILQFLGFSALQRAENSSNVIAPGRGIVTRYRFSALQRAENSSNRNDHLPHLHDHPFQCSSASRKFLKVKILIAQSRQRNSCFSALQRAENSSKDLFRVATLRCFCFSALQRAENSSNTVWSTICGWRRSVTELYSEPKIPQTTATSAGASRCRCFSALQRAENSSKALIRRWQREEQRFQCSSASRKFLKVTVIGAPSRVMSAFQCSSASRKFLKSSICKEVIK